MIWTMGEMIVEIMRETEDVTLKEAGRFLGPFPSGAPAIFIDTAAKMGHRAGIIGCVGDDEFGRCLTDRLTGHGVDCRYVQIDRTVSTGCAFVTYFSDGSRKFIFHLGNSAAGKARMPEIFERAELSGKPEIRGESERTGTQETPEIPACEYFHIMGCSLMADKTFGEEI